MSNAIRQPYSVFKTLVPKLDQAAKHTPSFRQGMGRNLKVSYRHETSSMSICRNAQSSTAIATTNTYRFLIWNHDYITHVEHAVLNILLLGRRSTTCFTKELRIGGGYRVLGSKGHTAQA